MSKLYLVKYDDNWSDELDVSGHCVINEAYFNKFIKALEKNPSFTFYIGTNEEIEYGEGEQSAQDAVSYQEITQEQLDVLGSLDLINHGRFAQRFIECVIDGCDDIDGYLEVGFYIVNSDNEEFCFISFDKAIEYCEEEYGYEGEGWEYIKDSRSFTKLEEFLDSDSVFCY